MKARQFSKENNGRFEGDANESSICESSTISTMLLIPHMPPPKPLLLS